MASTKSSGAQLGQLDMAKALETESAPEICPSQEPTRDHLASRLQASQHACLQLRKQLMDKLVLSEQGLLTCGCCSRRRSVMADAAIKFKNERVVRGRWKVLARLGAGGCGSVYKVEDMKHKGYVAAMKVEAFSEDDSGVLKLEASVLRKLRERQNVIRLIHSGKRSKYNFIVITLCGSDLMSLKRKSPDGFGESTILRIGIFSLYAIKQLHEVGFVHRDVKPGNIMNGANGRDRRNFYLIDYGIICGEAEVNWAYLGIMRVMHRILRTGMVRNFVVRDGKNIAIRKPRKNVLLRGTLRYCSLTVHRRLEQGRVDDLWAMIYMLCELYVGLPWNRITAEKEVMRMKLSEPDESVFRECPEEFVSIVKYLRTLTYQDRPDYHLIYTWLLGAMKRERYTFSEKYEWEDGAQPATSNLETAIEYSIREKSSKSALQGLDKEALLYPCIHEKNFKEVVLSV